MMLRIGKINSLQLAASSSQQRQFKFQQRQFGCQLPAASCQLNSAGFSLIELMLTVSFVMLGAILLQGSYMRSAEIFGRYTHSLQSMVWMEEQISKAKENLLVSSEDVPSESGVLLDGGKEINWSREVHPAAGSDLYSIGMTLSWKEGSKSIAMEGEQYVYKKPSTAL